MPGSPIRTPWDHSLVDSSPRPIAASHVLHRLLVPRHPPFALDNLTTTHHPARTHDTQLKTQPKPHTAHRAGSVQETRSRLHHRKQDARVHYTILNPQPTHNPPPAPAPTPAPHHPPRRRRAAIDRY